MKREHILVVTPREYLYEMLRYNLVKRSYQIDRAETKKDVMALAAAAKPPLAIVDYDTVNGNGLEMCRLISAKALPVKTQCILLAPAVTAELVKQAAEFGVRNFLAEPFALDDLFDKIDQVRGDSQNINIFKQSGKAIVALKGQMDHSFAVKLRHVLATLFSTGHENIIIDFSETEFFAHQNLMPLVTAQSCAEFHKGTISIVALDEGLQTLFNRAGLGETFSYYPDRVSAIRSGKKA